MTVTNSNRREESWPADTIVVTGVLGYIAKGIAEAHGGRMWAESEPGHGATFLFTLPVAREE